MKIYFFPTSLFCGFALLTSAVSAQVPHSDVEFGYDSLSAPAAFMIEQLNVTTEGIQIFESGLEELDPLDPGNFSSDEPGFATNAAEGLDVNIGDRFWLNVLNADLESLFGVGYVNYFNPATGLLEANGRLAVQDNSAGTADLILDGDSISSGVNPQFLGLATDIGGGLGDIHDHVVMDLLDDVTAPLGAYGILFQLQSDFASNGFGSMDLTSDKFWIVWNHGMDEADFDTLALPAFGVQSIPEPGSLALLGLASAGFLMRRRRIA